MNPYTSDIDFSYDSHVHFFGVGIPAVEYSIDPLSTKLEFPQHLLETEFINGFGWSKNLDQNEFDRICFEHPNKYFCLSSQDGHSSFISKNILEKLGFNPHSPFKFKHGTILSEVKRDSFYKLLPKRSDADLEKMALFAQDVFIKANVQKVRHLTGDIRHWEVIKGLSEKRKLKLEIEFFFSEFMGQSLDEAITTFNKISTETIKNVNAGGIKVFYDGSFGSKTAYTSLSNTINPRIDKSELLTKMRTVLVDNKLSLAIHCIGDKALEDTLTCYAELSKNQSLPTLHLEHAPIFSQKSLDLLKQKRLDCVFHFQPSHWIEDTNWYNKNKTGLQEHQIYPFKFLKENNYKFYFGSDAPVYKSSKDLTLKGLEKIEQDSL